MTAPEAGGGIQTTRPDDLPDDPEVLKAIIQEQSDRIEQLTRYLEQWKRWRFGKKSERVPVEQLVFEFVEAVEEEEAAKEPSEPPSAATEPARPKGHGRRVIPKDLPREVRTYDVAAEDRICAGCHGELEEIGEEVSEQLEYHPANLYVIQHRRKKYACRKCRQGVQTAEKPPQAVEKGLPGPGLLAHVAVSKYDDHLPLYRQQEIFARQGVEIPRSTLGGWMAAGSGLSEPLWQEMRKEVLKSKKIHTDDTPVPVLDESRDRTREGRLWVYVGDEAHPYVVFQYSPNRQKRWAEEFLGEYAGYLQADAYAGYDAMFTNGKAVEVGCWAHARRKFHEAQTTDVKGSMTALGWIRKLYEIEWEAQKKGLTAEGRRECRRRKAVPLLEGFHEWLEEQEREVMPRSPMGEAVGYVRNQWAALTRYVEDGDLEIDNNLAENEMRPVAVGRKNWLFAGSDEGGKRAAVIYSVIESCKRSGVNPFEYLRDVLDRIPTCPVSRVAELLPDRWKKARESAATSGADPPPGPDTS